MYSDKIYLTPQEILDKEFKIDARGYRPQEVDKYLDMIIRDYTEFINIIKRNEKEIKDLTEDNQKLKAEIRNLREQLVASENTSDGSSSNVDLLRSERRGGSDKARRACGDPCRDESRSAKVLSHKRRRRRRAFAEND